MNNTKRITADQAIALAVDVRHKKWLEERQSLEAYINDMITVMAKEGEHAVDIDKLFILNAEHYQAVCQDLARRGFGVLSDTIVGEDGLIDEVNMTITWFPKPKRGKKKNGKN